MRRSRREAGEGQVGCLVGLVILFIAIFIAYKMVPVKVKSAGSHSDDQIRKQILLKAQDSNLPVTDDSITIERTGNLIRVDVDYTVPIVFPGYTMQWHQHHHAENPIF